MKTKQTLAIVCMVAAMMQPMFFKAQSPAYRDAPTDNHEQKKVGWQSAKLDDSGNNVRNGVEFYTQGAGCTTKKTTSAEKTTFDAPHHHSVTPDMNITEQVTLVKLINTNTYAVKVSYQTADFSPVINVLVPPSATIEGVCGTTDTNLAKLVITPLPSKTDEEKQKNSAYLKAHIVVSEIK